MKRIMQMFIVLICLTGIIHAADRVSIHDIQYTTEPSGDSPYMGSVVQIEGIVTAIFYDGFFIADDTGAWNSLYVYSRKCAADIGDRIQVEGSISEFFGMTEMVNISGCQLISSGNTVAPTVVDTQSASQEQFESVLLKVYDISVTGLLDYGEWQINDGSGNLIVDDMGDYMYFAATGDYLDSVTGVLNYSYSAYLLEPRMTNDISGTVIPHYALKGDIVTMNASDDILEDAYIEVLGDKIISVTTTAPTGISIVDTFGLIFPGLIDSHNHPVYNVLGWIPFDEFYTERYEWQSDPTYSSFKNQFYGIRDYGGISYAQGTNIWKLAEVRALCAGTTMIQGFNCNGHSNDDVAHQGMIINNAERFPIRHYSSTFPLGENESYWANKKTEFWDKFTIHLSEGTSSGALQEFYTWVGWDMLDWRTSIIHGVPYTSTEWQMMADANATLIWSPMSNWLLYEATADAAGALNAEVNVALAPDWTESGRPNMLSEMKFANQINQMLFSGQITSKQFAEMVTRNAAVAIGGENIVGQLSPGYQADIMIIHGAVETPYDSLLAAEPADVKLTVVSGRPMYGDPDLMAQFPKSSPTEDIYICGQLKKLAIQVDAHGIPDSDKSIDEVVDELQTIYNSVSPKLCEFLSYDPCNGEEPTATPSTPTLTPTPTPTSPTSTPTPPITATPTPPEGSPTPENTPTPQECNDLGVEIWMPSYDLGPGDDCAIHAILCNPSVLTYNDIPLFVILEIESTYYFAPDFSDYGNIMIDRLEPGPRTEIIIDTFQWPSDVGSYSGVNVYGAMTDEQVSKLFGNFDVKSFGWHE